MKNSNHIILFSEFNESRTLKLKHMKMFEYFKKSLHDEVRINGVDMLLKFDTYYGSYIIEFEGLPDKILKLTEDPEVASEYFSLAKKVAQETGDVDKVFDEVQDKINSEISEWSYQ